MYDFIAEHPVLQTVLDICGVVLSATALLAFAGALTLCVTSKILAVRRRQVFHDKCARQMALLGMTLGWLLLVASRVWIHYAAGATGPAGSPLSLSLEAAWGTGAVAVLCISVAYALWPTLSKRPWCAMALAGLAALTGCASTLFSLGCARLVAGSVPGTEDAAILTAKLVPMFGTAYGNAVLTAIPLMGGLAGAAGAVWLLLRRRADDFGRDYYAAMIPWCATWSRNAWGVLWGLLLVLRGRDLWVLSRMTPLTPETAMLETARLLLWLIPFLLWTFVCRSSAPLRLKGLMVAGLLVEMGYTLTFFLELTDF
jgi:hypothetical protein